MLYTHAALVGLTLTAVLLYARHFSYWPFRPTGLPPSGSCSSDDFSDSISQACYSHLPANALRRMPSSGLTKAGELQSLRAAASATGTLSSSRSRAAGLGLYGGGLGPANSPLTCPTRSDTTHRGPGSSQCPPSSRNTGEPSEACSTPGVQVPLPL
jgi:hypothetical protein